MFSPETNLTKVSERLYSCLASLKENDTTYRSCVEEDASAVKAADAMEIEVLSSMEAAEQERLKSFFESLKRLVLAEEGTLRNMESAIDRFLATRPSSTSSAQTSAFPIPTISEAFAAYSSTTEDGGARHNPRPISGNVQAEADAFGLPLSAAQLRSDVIALWKRSSGILQFLTTLKEVVESLQSATDAYCLGLSSALTAVGYPTPEKGGSPSVDPTSLCMTIVKAEGPRCFQCWSSVVSSIVSQIRLGRAMHGSLHDLLEKLLPQAAVAEEEKALRQFKDTTDVVWKGVCEGGKNLGRAEAKWTQSESEVVKTGEKLKLVRAEMERERELLGAAGVEEGKDQDEGFGGMRRALGHVLNTLGTGDNLLSTKERLDLAEKAFERAKSSMAESKINLAVVTKSTQEKYEAYSKHFSEMFKLLSKGEKRKGEIGGELLTTVAHCLKEFVAGRQKNIVEAMSTVEKIEGSGDEGELSAGGVRRGGLWRGMDGMVART